MPIIKSAKKRVKVSAKAGVRNVKTKRAMRESIKALSMALQTGKSTEISKALSEATRAIDMAAKKNVIHKNKAARRKSQLAAQAKAAGAKPVKGTTKSTAKKPVVKKSPAKKSTAKKPAAKKAS